MTTMTMTENNNTPAEQFALALGKMKACSKARKWAEGLDYETAWNTCSNPDWLFFLIKKFTPLSPIQNELLICRFAREVLHLTTDPRVLACIEAREAWVRGEVNDELREVARDSAWDAAENTAWDTAWVTAKAAARAAAMDSALDSAWAAARDVMDATKSKQCDIIRELIPQPELV